MKQITLIEMDRLLKGRCIPSDLNINGTNAEYLVRKFGEPEPRLETALREYRSAGIMADNLEVKRVVLAAKDVGIKSAVPGSRDIEDNNDNMDDVPLVEGLGFSHTIEWVRRQIPAIDKAESRLCESRF